MEVAKSFVELGFVPMGVFLHQQAGEMKIELKPRWERATVGTFRDYCGRKDNGVALITGEVNDLIVISCDPLKDRDGAGESLAAFEACLQEFQHHLPNGTPIQSSASGGKQYFFSLSKSMMKGLNSIKSSNKIKINDYPMIIDIHADGGFVIVDSSCNGNMKYSFVSPLICQKDLPAMPNWCMEILNNNDPLSEGGISQGCLCHQMGRLSLGNNEDHEDHEASVFLSDVKTVIEKILGTGILKIWPRFSSSAFVGFDFKSSSIVKCALCGTTHDSGIYQVRPIIDDCFVMGNYSCKYPPRAFNWESHDIFQTILQTPKVDEPYCMMLKASLRIRGHQLVEMERAKNKRTVKRQLMYFNGHIWQEISEQDVHADIAGTCRKILETLLKNIHPKYNADNDEIEAVEQQRSQIAAGLAYLKTASNLKSILLNYRIDGIAKIQESSLDVNPNILVVRNGVIELATGELRSGLPSDYMSRQLNIEYKGIDSKTGVIEDYISELFDTDQGVIRYLQRMLGYGITGRADSQIWAIFTGEGSNGKSLLVELLECLLEDWVVPAPPEIFFKNPQRVRVGSHSTHLGTLKGARICIKEEAEQNDKLNTEDIKKISAGATITMRAAHASTFEKFKPTVLPILLRYFVIA